MSQFLDATANNTLVSVHQYQEWYDRISRVDREFHRLVEGLDNNESPLAAVFVMRAHAAFLAGTRVGLGTQVPEAFMLLRGCLEAAAYGLYLADHEETRDIWVKRQDSAEARVASKKRFQMRVMSDHLKSRDPATSERFQRMYEWCIDLGAHPNAWAVVGHLAIEESDTHTRFELQYLTTDPTERVALLKDIATTGVIALDVFRNIFRHRFDILGVTERLDALKREL